MLLIFLKVYLITNSLISFHSLILMNKLYNLYIYVYTKIANIASSSTRWGMQ